LTHGRSLTPKTPSPSEAGSRSIPLLLRIPSTARKLYARSRRPAYAGAPAAFDGRMLVLSVTVLAAALAIAPWDAEISRWAVASPAKFVRTLAVYTDIGKSTLYLVSAFVVTTWLSLRDWRKRHLSTKARFALLYSQAAFAFAAIAGSGIAVNVLKFIFARARPKFLAELGPYHFFGRMGLGYDYTSFPSGHSTTMGALAAILALWYPKLRIISIPLCFLGAASRVAAGAHFPSDVIAGFGLGGLFSIYLARALARRQSVFHFSDGALFPKLQFSGSFSR
jgi:membrane-associated phospholipid phosphatase